MARRWSILVLGSWLGLATLAHATDAPVELTVYAAASLREVLTALASSFDAQAGTHTTLNLGASGDLARQILAANKADVFVSADEDEMDRLVADRLVEATSQRTVTANQLAVIAPQETAATLFPPPFAVEHLAAPGIRRLSIANPGMVPAGRYARAWLQKQGVWPRVKDRVLPALDVRAALAAVASGAADAGIVYRTDAAHAASVQVVFAVPPAEGPRIVYVAAALAARPHVPESRRFVDFLESAAAQAAFDAAGFLALHHVPARAQVPTTTAAPPAHD